MGKSAINPAVVGKHSTDIAALKNDLGIVEDGDTATHTIAQGQYVIWQGALYTADAAIASGTTLAASGGNKNLTAVENGGLNALNSNVANLNSSTSKSIINGYIGNNATKTFTLEFKTQYIFTLAYLSNGNIAGDPIIAVISTPDSSNKTGTIKWISGNPSSTTPVTLSGSTLTVSSNGAWPVISLTKL